MHITIKHFNDQFNVLLHSKEGKPEFLTIKGCRIVQGQKGPFVSWPASKTAKGDWWNHVWANEDFANAVLEKANTQPKKPQKNNVDDIPF